MRNKGIARNGFYDDTNLFDWIIVVLNKYVWFMCYILLSNVVTIENIMLVQLFIFDVDASVFTNDVDALIYQQTLLECKNQTKCLMNSKNQFKSIKLIYFYFNVMLQIEPNLTTTSISLGIYALILHYLKVITRYSNKTTIFYQYYFYFTLGKLVVLSYKILYLYVLFSIIVFSFSLQTCNYSIKILQCINFQNLNPIKSTHYLWFEFHEKIL